MQVRAKRGRLPDGTWTLKIKEEIFTYKIKGSSAIIINSSKGMDGRDVGNRAWDGKLEWTGIDFKSYNELCK